MEKRCALAVIRTDLAKGLASSAGTSAHNAELVSSTMLDAIGARLAEGHRIELRGFGVFERRQQAARLAHNPRTGEPNGMKANAKTSHDGGA